MYRDLDPTKWPTSGLVTKEWIQAALDGRDPDTTKPVTDDEVTTALHINPILTVRRLMAHRCEPSCECGEVIPW